MTDILGVLNIGKGALATNRTAINVAGHNIANVNTPGYTRQRVNMTSISTVGYQDTRTGNGVKITDIERIYDRFINRQIALENEKLGYWDSMKACLERIEIDFNEATGFGLGQAMNDFWNAWHDLSNSPTGYVERISLLSKSNTLAMTFNQNYSSLSQIQDNISDDVTAGLEEVNLTVRQIRNLNQQIQQTEVNGQHANDLRDQRDLLIKELSLMIDIEITDDNEGKINIAVSGGHSLLSGADTWTLSTAPNPDPDRQDIVVWQSEDGSMVDITNELSGGKIKGLIDVRDTIIPDYLDRMNELAENLINSVNNLHTSGDDLNGNAGGLFFDLPDAATPAKYIHVNIEDTNLIVVADSGGGVGDNTKARDIAELQNDLTMNSNTASYGDFYQSLVSDVGNAVQNATTNFDHQSSMVSHLNNYRESLSGVSLDEEMVNLVKFQHAYDAAAKLISTVDEMLETLLNMV